MLLCSIGAAQATILRRHLHHAGRWVAANALGWLAGLPVVLLALAVAPEHPAEVRAAFAIAGDLLVCERREAVVASAFLVRLLRHPESRLTRSRAVTKTA